MSPIKKNKYMFEPLSVSESATKKFLRCEEVTLKELDIDNVLPKHRKGYIDLQILRMIANSKNNNNNQLKYYKHKDHKKAKSTGYRRLFFLRVIRSNQSVNNLVYIIEDSLRHLNLWNDYLSIRDNGGITVGSIIRFFRPKPYEDVMPDLNPMLESRFPACIMKDPAKFLEVNIDYKVEGGQSLAFCFNNCIIDPLSIAVEDSGCAGLFCDKQRILEVRQYGEGCCCYSYDSKRTNAIVDHTFKIRHHGFVEEGGVIMVNNFSSVRFSSLYQKSVFSNQIRQNALELTDAFFDLEDAVEQVIHLINSNGGFTVIGWYKRGEITDRTLLHQKKKIDSQKQSNETSDVQIDNSTINYHLCVIKPTKTSFFDKKSKLYEKLAELKFDSSVLLHSS